MGKIIEIINDILSNSWIAYPISWILVLLGIFTCFYVLWTIFISYRIAKNTGKPTSWLKITDDIRWTLYSWDDRDQEWVMSLPRLIYFISSVLIVYVVIVDETDMLVPLLGFNLSAMVSYSGKSYIETRDKSEELKINDNFKLRLAKINAYCQENANLAATTDTSAEDDSLSEGTLETEESTEESEDTSASAKAVLDE